MKYLKLSIIFLILLAMGMSGCSTSQNIRHEVVKPDGSPFPDPLYVIQSVDQRTPVRMSFFYSSLKVVKDIDGREIPTIKFLNRKANHMFLSEDGQSIQLVARVLNPRNIKYKVFCRRHVEFEGGGTLDSMTLVAYSDMKYREFIRELPTDKGVKSVTYALLITDFAENPLVGTGQFNYYIQ